MEDDRAWLGNVELLMVAVGIIEAYVKGYPLLLGLGLGLLFGLMTVLGTVPIFGQVAYYYAGKLIMSAVGGWFGWVFWTGFIVSIVVSIVSFFALLLLGEM